jgi:hypothetical protein
MEEEPISKSQLEELTYPCPRLRDFILDDNLPALVFPPSNGHIRKLPKVDLGTLDVLPLELLQGLLSQLDLCTLMGFRRVNRPAIDVVESKPQYKAVTTHARNVLRGILSIGTGQWISCESLYKNLCTAECKQCGDFGGYLYILASAFASSAFQRAKYIYHYGIATRFENSESTVRSLKRCLA